MLFHRRRQAAWHRRCRPFSDRCKPAVGLPRPRPRGCTLMDAGSRAAAPLPNLLAHPFAWGVRKKSVRTMSKLPVLVCMVGDADNGDTIGSDRSRWPGFRQRSSRRAHGDVVRMVMWRQWCRRTSARADGDGDMDIGCCRSAVRANAAVVLMVMCFRSCRMTNARAAVDVHMEI